MFGGKGLIDEFDYTLSEVRAGHFTRIVTICIV
jgi:hypothetical protein